MPKPSVPITTHLTPELFERLESYVHKTGMTKRAVIESALKLLFEGQWNLTNEPWVPKQPQAPYND